MSEKNTARNKALTAIAKELGQDINLVSEERKTTTLKDLKRELQLLIEHEPKMIRNTIKKFGKNQRYPLFLKIAVIRRVKLMTLKGHTRRQMSIELGLEYNLLTSWIARNPECRKLWNKCNNTKRKPLKEALPAIVDPRDFQVNFQKTSLRRVLYTQDETLQELNKTKTKEEILNILKSQSCLVVSLISVIESNLDNVYVEEILKNFI